MPSTPRVVGRRVQIAVTALLAALLLTLAGCSAGEPRPIGPAGIDGLEIPTPSPDPTDFVGVIDNPFLPLAAGSEWTYRRAGGAARAVGERITVAVSEETRTISGVAATEVRTTVAGSDEPASVDFFAQDRAGNVWSFGSDEWLAGLDGARAGLVMPATPRVGDGFFQQDAAGVARARSEVLDTTASASTAYGSWSADLVELLETHGPGAEEETRRFYAPGVGLVLSETDGATTELVSFTP